MHVHSVITAIYKLSVKIYNIMRKQFDNDIFCKEVIILICLIQNSAITPVNVSNIHFIQNNGQLGINSACKGEFLQCEMPMVSL